MRTIGKQTRNTLADNLRAAAEKAGIGINALADVAGVSSSQTYDVLNCSTGASVDFIDQVAAALGVEPFMLLRPRTQRGRNSRNGGLS